jgi:hypothetical protein
MRADDIVIARSGALWQSAAAAIQLNIIRAARNVFSKQFMYISKVR